MNVSIYSKECGSRCRSNPKKLPMPCCHILAGIAYFNARRFREGLAKGCCEAKKSRNAHVEEYGAKQ